MTKQPYRTGDRVEYIGTPYVVGTIVAVHPGVDPYEIRWDNPALPNARLGRGQFCRAIGYDQREHPRPHDGRG